VLALQRCSRCHICQRRQAHEVTQACGRGCSIELEEWGCKLAQSLQAAKHRWCCLRSATLAGA
jgi:hypothetical protein